MKLGKNQKIILEFLWKNKGRKFYLTQLEEELKKQGYDIDIHKIKSAVRRLYKRGLINREVSGSKTFVWVDHDIVSKCTARITIILENDAVKSVSIQGNTILKAIEVKRAIEDLISELHELEAAKELRPYVVDGVDPAIVD